MKEKNQKLKLLYLARILLEKTDENNKMTVADMINELNKYNIHAERKSIYDDLECLRMFGLDICYERTGAWKYFIGSRMFELPELKLLVDSVQSSRFITKKKSAALISKIEALTSVENAKQLHSQVFIMDRAKTINERIYYNVDRIYDAIAKNRQITFKYFDMNVKKEKVYRKNGGVYTESPMAMTWNDEKYYLITYKKKYGKFVHYRVDRMEETEITEQERNLPADKFNLPEYIKMMFGMYGGDEKIVTIKFTNNLTGPVYDKFGMDAVMYPQDEEHFICRAKVALSPRFFAWIMSFGKNAVILEPENVRREFLTMLKNIQENYSD